MFYLLITVVTFCLMECVTWLTHKYVMHGFMWYFHEDHHQPTAGFFEKNDFFFLIFAFPSMMLMLFGSFEDFDWRFFVGLGILFYGIAYFLVHDVLIHRRFNWFDKTNNMYFRAIRKAHKIHHKQLGRQDASCFGMLFVPLKYFTEAKRSSSKTVRS